MTATLTEKPDGTSPSPVKRRAVWLIPVGLAVAALIIVGIIVLGSDSSGVADRQQLGSVQRVCAEWSGNSASNLGTTSASAACSRMASWMDQQLRNGQTTGPMMWGSATTLDSVCRHWMETGSRASISTTASPAWCDEMVSQMQQHIGNWGDWMMNGNMMGSDSTGSSGGT